ncbi:hypothetical protein JTE90_020550 [Oedothorax gibbosus]|uniref:Uncharacterized protein n=1 Tax=Oedothorax gibbosus TaxID=931172 RepID=A0AAV6VW33_9ARAC|nr:hypothetical protein JTE90_020550 [Oedothorax gibbosus]
MKTCCRSPTRFSFTRAANKIHDHIAELFKEEEITELQLLLEERTSNLEMLDLQIGAIDPEKSLTFHLRSAHVFYARNRRFSDIPDPSSVDLFHQAKDSNVYIVI